jgi:hypothetical protein
VKISTFSLNFFCQFNFPSKSSDRKMPISDFQSRADVDHTQKIFFYEKVLKLPFVCFSPSAGHSGWGSWCGSCWKNLKCYLLLTLRRQLKPTLKIWYTFMKNAEPASSSCIVGKAGDWKRKLHARMDIEYWKEEWDLEWLICIIHYSIV